MPRTATCVCGTCKKCKQRVYMRSYYLRNPSQLQKQRDRQRGPKGRAHSAVRNAVRRGDLSPEPCLFCDDPVTFAHHHDYLLPLEVTWLCGPHHALVHKSLSKAA